MITPKVSTHIKKDVLDDMARAYAKAKGAYVTAGIHEGLRSYSGSNAPTVGQVALWMEYGAPARKVPRRPFLGPAVANNKSAIATLLGKNLALIAYNKISVHDALDSVGRQAKLFIQAAIQAGPGPALSGNWEPPSGYLGRKRLLGQPSQTLIASGVLLSSVTYKVVSSKAQKQGGTGGGPTHGNADRRAKERTKKALSRKTRTTQRDEHSLPSKHGH